MTSALGSWSSSQLELLIKETSERVRVRQHLAKKEPVNSVQLFRYCTAYFINMLRDLGGMKTSISGGRKNEANDDEGLSTLCFEKQATKRECDTYIYIYCCVCAQQRKILYEKCRAAKPAASVSVYEYIHVSFIFPFPLFLLEKPERSMASVTFPYLVIGCCTLWYCSPF